MGVATGRTSIQRILLENLFPISQRTICPQGEHLSERCTGVETQATEASGSFIVSSMG